MPIDARQVEFIKLLAATERRLAGYILTLVPNLNDAEEIIQETHVRLWEMQDKYTPGSNFAAWALRVGYYEVLTWRKRRARERLIFDDSLLCELKQQLDNQGNAAEGRHGALIGCLSELSEQSLSLLMKVYRDGEKVKDVASKMGRTAESVYKVLQRLRLALRSCVEQKLAEERAT